ncbi:MAG TPA: flagellar hook-basal body complex protein [Planctomycetes bacterium]|nr:flagellar hook-basal body complex protein [Planctomycetota bacterium]
MVSTSLFTGLSGMRAQQRFIDVIGNNLANVNTPGFWSSRVTFSDLLSSTLSPGQGPAGLRGGINPMQIGLGAQVSSIDPNTNQGTFLNTGRPLDVAMKGAGFFVLSDGTQNFYTRVGSFGVDSDRNLIDLRTGMSVIDSAGNSIPVPLTGTLPAKQTSSVSFQGTLPAKVTGPLAEVVSSTAPYYEGTAASKTATISFPLDMSSLSGNTFTISVNGGSPQTVTINTTNFGSNLSSVDFATFKAGIEGQTTGVTVTQSGTTVTISTDKVGKDATIKMDNGSGTPLSTLGFNTVLSSGTQTAATSTTSLNDLTINNTDYGDGDSITISGTDPAGNKVAGTFTYGASNDGTTLGDLVTFMNTLFQSSATTGATGAISSDGTLTLTANDEGEAKLSLFISDAGSTAKTNYTSFKVTREGTGPDTVTTSIDVYDSLGRGHPVTMTLTRDETDHTIWSLKATMDSSEGTLVDDSVGEIRFNSDGSFNVVTDTNQSLEFSFNDISTTQTVTLDFGTSSSFDGLSMLGDKSTAAATDQDGYAAGQLLNIAFNEEGTLQGFYTNGQNSDIATLRIALFPNPAGLNRIGDTLFVESPNSDNAIITTAGNAGTGSVVSGALENSNVDIAEEFVRLIEAQRGFQANARVITTTDQVLSEMINIVR